MLAAHPVKAAPLVVDNLRPPNAGQTIIVDTAPNAVVDPSINFIGAPMPGPGRMLWALALNPGPALLSPPTVVSDTLPAFPADPALAVLGQPSVWVSRMLLALPTESTRGF